MNGSVCMDELQDELPREHGDWAPRRLVEQWRNAMYAKLSTTQLTVSDVQNNTISKFADVERRIQRIEEHVWLIARGMSLGARGRDRRR